jgi:hypothetical protein
MKYLLQIFFLTIPFLLQAQQLYEQKIYPFDGQQSDYFDASVSVNDSFVIVGSPLATSVGERSGKVYVYKITKDSLEFFQMLVPGDLDPESNFGVGTCLENNNLVIGARHKRVNGIRSGVIYYYKYNGIEWESVQKIEPPDPVSLMYFGEEIYKNGDMLFVGVINEYEQYSGSVYYFQLEEGLWNFKLKIFPLDFKPYHFFGSSVAAKDNYLIVGAYADSNKNGIDAGAIYIFEKVDSLFIQKEKIISRNGSQNYAFGSSVDYDGKFLIAGEPGDIYSNIVGSVHLYKRDNDSFIFLDQVHPSDGQTKNYFGLNIVISGCSVAIGALGDNIYVGACYLYKIDNQTLVDEYKIVPSDTNANTFANSLDLFNDKVIGGAPSTLNNSIRSGAAYFYQRKVTNVSNELDNQFIENDTWIINYPNPFNFSTIFFINLKSESKMELSIYNVIGEKVATLYNGVKDKGKYEFIFEASNLVSGIYLAVLKITEEGKSPVLNKTKICLLK